MNALPLSLGPQYAGDDAFTARMRLHQSWYRAEVLRVAHGVGPHARSPSRYGNMLTADDGERGLNFLTPQIASYACVRQAEFPSGIKKHRLLCNMLSSQPMCFNLFAPIALDRELAPALLAGILGTEVAHVDSVIIEHAPKPKSDYLDDNTSFDAYVEYRKPNGARSFVGIETKLTEPFTQTVYARSDPGRARWVEHAKAPWLTSAHELLDARGHNQLWRDHMLGFAHAMRAKEPYASWSVAVVRHSLDHKCGRAMEAYGKCVQAGDETLVDRPLDGIAERMRARVSGTRWAGWWREFERRYVDLSASEG